MGDELPKENICAVFESSSEIKTDTALQGLLGRCCGYHKKDIDIFVPPKFINTGLKEYIESIENSGATGLSNCMNVGMRKKESKRGKLGFPIVPIHMTSSEVGLTESDIKQIRESDRIKESWSKKNNKKVINYLLESSRSSITN